MQFHHDGFHAGDPDIYKLAKGQKETMRDMPNEVDVLIVGSGPAGLTLAAQLAAHPDITTRIIDLKPGPMEKGQADGISCRSM
ncbi:FAD-dependent monooxygenase, partial [Planktomarina sp.]|nr:FAD-dependent monooxygenase [Planktomarina sp.]